MSEETSGISVIRNYLLGDLPESKSEEVERGYFGFSDGVDEVWAVFGEIVEEYLSGELSESDSRRFEQKLKSSPALLEMFENEKALYHYAARNPSGASKELKIEKSASSTSRKWRPPALFFKPTQLIVAGAAAMIALTALISWFTLRNRGETKPADSAEVQNPQTTPEGNKSTAIVPQPSDQPIRPTQPRRDTFGKPVSFLLLATGTRGDKSDPSILDIPMQTEAVQIELELANEDCAEYSAELRAEANNPLQRWERVRARRDTSSLRVVSLRVRPDSLKNADYSIRLTCVSNPKASVSAGEFHFKVVKK